MIHIGENRVEQDLRQIGDPGIRGQFAPSLTEVEHLAQTAMPELWAMLMPGQTNRRIARSAHRDQPEKRRVIGL